MRVPSWSLLCVVLMTGCVLTRFKEAECETNQECQAAFGWGHSCDTEGLCAEVTPAPRCESTWPSDLFSNREKYAEHIVIGMDYDTTAFSLEALAMRLAIIQANEAQGLEGQEYALIECTNIEDATLDELTQEEANESVALWLADEIGVPAILGPATSPRTEAAFLTVEPYGTMMISPSATSPALTALDGLTSTADDPGLLWRTSPPDDLQGMVIAQDMLDRGNVNAAVIYEIGAYGEGLQQAFYDVFTAGGGTAALYLFDEDYERDEAINEVGYSDHDEVLFISSEKEDITKFFLAAGQIAAYADIAIFLADGAYDEQIFLDASAYSHLFANVHGTRPTSEKGSIFTNFSTSFAAEFGEDATASGYTAYAYDASWLVLYGTAWSLYQEGEISGLGIARGMRKVSALDDVEIKATSWSTVKASFAEGTHIDVEGSSGSLDYDPETGETTAPIEVWKVQYKNNEVVFSEDYTTEP